MEKKLDSNYFDEMSKTTLVNQCSSTRLKPYEEALEIHLKKVLTEMEEEENRLKAAYKQEKSNLVNIEVEESRLQKKIRWIKRKVDSIQQQTSLLTKKDPSIIFIKNEDLEKSLEQGQMHLKVLAQQEKEVQRQLHKLNVDIANATVDLETAVRPKKKDARLLKIMAGKALGSVVVLEKEKCLQDAYISRLKKDIQLAERELFKLVETAKVVKNQYENSSRRYSNLSNRLKSFATGSMKPLKDHWQHLLKALRLKDNMIKLMDEDIEDNETTGQNDASTPLFKSRALALKNSDLEEEYIQLKNIQKKQKRIMIIQQQNNETIRQLLNRRSQQNLPELKKLIEQQENIKDINSKKANKLIHQYNERRLEMGLDTVEGEHLHQLISFEKVEKETIFIEKKIEVYKDLLAEMHRANFVSEQTEPHKNNSQLKRNVAVNKQVLLSPTSANLKTCSNMRKQLTYLTRKRLALEHKKERLQEQVVESQQKFKKATQNNLSLSRELKKLDNESNNQLNMALLKEIDDEEDIATHLDKKLEKLMLRREEVKLEIVGLRQQLQEIQNKCEEWKAKTGSFEPLRSAADNQLKCVMEIHALQKAYQGMELKLWKTQKELEFTVMHRDYAVNKAYTVLGTGNETVSQRAEKNRDLQEEIKQLELETRNCTF